MYNNIRSFPFLVLKSIPLHSHILKYVFNRAEETHL
jgi:hypothetical protein